MKVFARLLVVGAMLTMGLVAAGVAPTMATAAPQPAAPMDAPGLAAQRAAALVAGRPAFLNASPDEAFQQGTVISSSGIQYVPYQRTHAGVPVIGGDFVVVVNGAGTILNHSAALQHPIGGIAMTARVSKDDAVGVATGQLRSISSVESTRLVVDALGSAAHLAWESTVDGVGTEGVSRLTVYVDAISGRVLDTREHVAAGSGTAGWNGPNPVPLNTTESGATFFLADPKIKNLACQALPANTTFSGPDDVWGNGNPANLETGCVDALFGAQTEARMLSQWLGRNGMDGAGGAWPIRVGLDDQNAFYDGTEVQIGHNTVGQSVGALDIIAHEMGHGIDDHTPGSISKNGTQEFIADAFGAATEWFAQEPAPFDVPDFTVGEQVNLVGHGPIRIMYRPSLLGDPDCFSKSVPGLEVHAAAGVGNHWFYLLAEGSNPTDGQPASPTCNGSAVTGVGVQNTIKILYNAMLMKTSASSYPMYRTWTLQAALNLFPNRCDVFKKVRAAWDAVGVGAQLGEPTCTPPIDGTNVSHPAVLGSPNSGNLAVFVNSAGRPTENVYTVSNNRWSGPTLLPGALSADASPVAIGDPNGGNMAVFFNSGGGLVYDYYIAGLNQWGGPYVLAGDMVGDPSVLGSPNSGNLAVFYRSTANTLNEKYYFVASNTWIGPFAVASGLSSAPAATGNPNGGNIAVFYTSNNSLTYSYYLVSQNQWVGPFTLAAGASGQPIVRGDTGNLAVFFTSTMVGGVSGLREMFYLQPTNNWVGPWTLPGTVVDPPVAALGSPDSGNIALFFNSWGDENALVEDVYDVSKNAWTGPIVFGGFVQGMAEPAAVGDPNGGNMAVFYTSGDIGHPGELALNYFFGGFGTWSGPMFVGGTVS